MNRFSPTKFDAILKLVGNTKHFSVSPEGEFKWLEDTDDGKPSEEDIQTKLASMISDFDAQEYARNRENEYPTIQDVTVALAEKEEGDSTMWDEITAKRAAIKTKYPKPS